MVLKICYIVVIQDMIKYYKNSNISKLQNLKLEHKCIILGSSWMKEENLVAEKLMKLKMLIG